MFGSLFLVFNLRMNIWGLLIFLSNFVPNRVGIIRPILDHYFALVFFFLLYAEHCSIPNEMPHVFDLKSHKKLVSPLTGSIDSASDDFGGKKRPKITHVLLAYLNKIKASIFGSDPFAQSISHKAQ